jgi:hypothetical protein
MEESRMKKGTHVIISDDLSNTKKAYGTNSDMEQMSGKTYRIDAVETDPKGKYAVVNYFSWHPKDLIECSPEKDPEPLHFHFDAKELII